MVFFRCLPALLTLGLVAALPAGALAQQDGSAQDVARKARGAPEQRTGAATRGAQTTLQPADGAPTNTVVLGNRSRTEADDPAAPRPPAAATPKTANTATPNAATLAPAR